MEKAAQEVADAEMHDTTIDEDGDPEAMDTEEEGPRQVRSLRRAEDRALERKRKLQEEEREKKEKAEAAKQPKGSKQYQKVLKKIEQTKETIKELEESIKEVDNDLREADCHRTRCLGKDRFWNRYWWFERNAMPYAGLPESSTAAAEYANGLLWIQGPDDMEREGFINLDEAEQQAYRAKHNGVSVPERKALEEGKEGAVVRTAYDWAYIDSKESLDGLIAWLDVRGFRELKLRKELTLQKERIATYMENRAKYLAASKPATSDEREDSEDPVTDKPAKRMVTRTKTHASDTNFRSLKWRNDMVLESLGHRHADLPPAPRGAKKSGKKK